MADTLLALIVLSLFVVQLTHINLTGTKAAAETSQELTAALIAKALIEDPSIRSHQGSFQIKGTNYGWRRETLERPGTPTDRAALIETHIEVRWPADNPAHSYEVQSTRMRGRS